MKISLVIIAALAVWHSAAAQILTKDYGFENQPPGKTGALWEPYIGNGFTNQIVEGSAYAGNKCARIVCPGSASHISQYTSLGQTLDMQPGMEYTASVMVKWANYAGKEAIISFWTYKKIDNQDNFYGKDVWLKDGNWHKLTYNFCNPMSTVQQFKPYASVLPQQILNETHFLLDNFIVTRAGNLARDFSFEESAAGPIGATGLWQVKSDSKDFTAVIENSKANSGYNSAAVTITENAATRQKIELAQSLKLAKGADYEAYCYVNWQNAGGAAVTVMFEGVEAGGATVFSTPVKIDKTGWRKISASFTATNASSDTYELKVGLHSHGRKIVLGMDDFSVFPIKRLEPIANNSNIMDDPGFENQPLGNIGASNSGWSCQLMNPNNFTHAIVNENPHSGSKCAKIGIPANTGNFSSLKLGQTKKLVPGAKYQVETWVNWVSDNPGADGYVILIFWLYHVAPSTPSSTLAWYGRDDMHISTRGWHKQSFPFVVPYGEQDDWEVYVSVNGWGNYGSPAVFLIDDFTMKRLEGPNDQLATAAMSDFDAAQPVYQPVRQEHFKAGLLDESAAMVIYNAQGRIVSQRTEHTSPARRILMHSRNHRGNAVILNLD